MVAVLSSHNLDEILAHLPELVQRVQAADQGLNGSLLRSLKRICGEWKIFVRYSPRTAAMAEANEFLERVKELKAWLG
ncbi:MAG: hypothetical protein AMXMBFR13_17420 [Phycisphaerae bacterium]